MTANALIKDASCIGPTATVTGTTYVAKGVISYCGLRGVMRYATSSTSQPITMATVAVPGNESDNTINPLRGKWLRIQNEDLVNPLDFAFGAGSAPTLVYGQPATFGTGSAAAGWRIMPGTYIDVIVPLDATHISHIQPASAPAATVAFYCSEGSVGDK